MYWFILALGAIFMLGSDYGPGGFVWHYFYSGVALVLVAVAMWIYDRRVTR